MTVLNVCQVLLSRSAFDGNTQCKQCDDITRVCNVQSFKAFLMYIARKKKIKGTLTSHSST